MARKKKHAEHVNHERWLVSYADFITLLFATFTALFAISNADKDKFKKMAESLRNAFTHNGSAQVVDVRADLLKGMQAANASPVALNIKAQRRIENEGDPDEIGGSPEPLQSNPNPGNDEPSWDDMSFNDDDAGEGRGEADNPAEQVTPTPTPTPTPEAEKAAAEATATTPEGQQAEVTPTPTPTSGSDVDGSRGGEGNADAQMQAQIKQALDMAGLDGKVAVRQDARGMVISMGEAGFFAAGAVDVLPASRHQLARIINLLRQKQYEVRIEGHTDNIPVGPGRVYRSNMELSSMRASRIADFMASEYNYPLELISSAGYGESRPIGDNATPEGRGKNRRIDIVILNNRERTFEPRAHQ